MPAVAERWTYPPYGVTIEGDRVYGLGTADMKGGVACIVGAALELLETDAKTNHTVVLAFTADEEGDMGGARSLVHAGVFAQAKFLVVAEPTDGQVYVGEKGQLWLRVAFTGQATHGATPSLGRNAALAAADLALRLEELATTSDFGEGTTFNVGRLTGGERVNAVPEHAELDLDVRFADPLVDSAVLREVRRVVRAVEATRQVVAAVAVLRHLPPLRTDAANAYVRALTAAADAAFGRRTQAELAPYATDAKVIVPPTRVPFAVFGPGCITQAHGPDEYVSLPSLVRTETALATFLRGL
ncbi:M20/M25/M40 family metallo-hydrolase [Candidatus Bipolaricaulota bacterium]|nr:M20/M25/M40 family metallo-hydrolase [Candidatus Bipolaricaulota bacterium]